MKRIEKKIGEFLVKNNLQISTAESCTGGLISSILTDVAGSSAYIRQNFVTYSNEAKSKYLGVKKETLKEFGAVSSQVATQMAQGLLEKTQSDITLCTTGVAGPSCSENKPVGLIFIGVADKNKVKILKYNVDGTFSRKKIKKLFADKALDFLYNFLLKEVKNV